MRNCVEIILYIQFGMLTWPKILVILLLHILVHKRISTIFRIRRLIYDIREGPSNVSYNTNLLTFVTIGVNTAYIQSTQFLYENNEVFMFIGW